MTYGHVNKVMYDMKFSKEEDNGCDIADYAIVDDDNNMDRTL